MNKVINIKADNNNRFNENFKYCIGTGRLSLALRKDYLDALRKVQEDIGFKYIRGHGLLCDDIGIYREYTWKGEEKILYNYTYIDKIFDSFLEIGIKPFVEIGFMPEALASSTETIFWWKGNVTPPKDYAKWRNLIDNLIRHFIERYGIDEVLTWPFEVWNEPNLKNFWKDADQKEYFKLYKETVKVIKNINDKLQVGGPAICGGSDYWMKDFLDFCYNEKVPVDFLSRHAYSSQMPEVIPYGVYQDLNPSEGLLDDFKSGREYIKESKFHDMPVHITEFNTSYKPVNLIHDTAYNATYLAKVISEGGDYVDSFSYWTFSDVFEEEDIPKSLFHGGFGLLAFNEIKKPTYYLYEFFAKLSGVTLYKDESIHITKKDNGEIAFVAWNECSTVEEINKKEFKISLPIEADTVFVQRSIVNENYGNGWNCWRKLGKPRFPSKKQIEIIKKSSNLKIENLQYKVNDNKLELNFTLSKNELSLFEIYIVSEEKQGYDGMDDRKITSYI